MTADLRAVAALISATQLRERLDGRHVVLLDARSGPGARERYDAPRTQVKGLSST